MAAKSMASSERRVRGAFASSTMASPSGCSEPRSADAARRSSSSVAAPSAAPSAGPPARRLAGAATMSVTSGLPRVSVPVLSSTMASSL